MQDTSIGIQDRTRFSSDHYHQRRLLVSLTSFAKEITLRYTSYTLPLVPVYMPGLDLFVDQAQFVVKVGQKVVVWCNRERLVDRDYHQHLTKIGPTPEGQHLAICNQSTIAFDGQRMIQEASSMLDRVVTERDCGSTEIERHFVFHLEQLYVSSE